MDREAMQSTRETPRSGLALANCSECRRRKQKCNREWPCNRCHARKVPHLCHFGGSTTSSTRLSRSTRTRYLRHNRGSAEDRDNGQQGLEAQDVEAAVRALRSNFQLGHRSWTAVVIEQPRTTSTEAATAELRSALDLLYSSEFTGILIQQFLYRGHYYHYILYDAQFTEEYAQWGQDRRSGRPVSVAFTCLVLRVCACAAQSLPAGKRADVEDAFSRSSQSLAQIFHDHAQRLGASVSPGTGGLAQVQQLMLGVIWLQHESQWTASWHALAAAIHEAQEQDMHMDSDDPNVTDFEKDMKRQAWCLLCAWDWQSCILFGRPSIINQETYAAKVPVLQLHSLASGSGHDGDGTLLPTPSTHMLLQYELASRVTKLFGTVTLPLPVEAAMNIVAEIRRWLDTFPEVYRNVGTSLDMSLDKNKNKNVDENNWLAPQVAHLHSLAYIVIFTILKPFIALSDIGMEDADADGGNFDVKDAVRQGVDAAITVMDINHALYKAICPDCSQPNAVMSAVVSASAFLCQAILYTSSNSEYHALLRRQDVIASLGKALDMLCSISSESQQAVAQTAFPALHRLALQLPLSVEERALLRSSHHVRQGQGRGQGQQQQRSAMQSTKRSASARPNISQLSMLHHPAANTNADTENQKPLSGTPISQHTSRMADIANGNSLMARPFGFCNASDGDYVVGRHYPHSTLPAHHALSTSYPYSMRNVFQQMPLPAYEARNGGGLAIYNEPAPLSQTTSMAELHGLGESLGESLGENLSLEGVAAWPMDMTAKPPFVEQPDDGQDDVMEWRG